MAKFKTILHKNEWLSLYKMVDKENHVDGYIYSHETRCNGKIIAVLLFRKNKYNYEFGLRNEVTPCWNLKPEISSLTGGVEKNDPVYTALMEIKEEAGYEVDKSDLIDLGTSYASKSADTVYYLYAVDVTDKESGETSGDGTYWDENADIIWLDGNSVSDSKDPQVSVLYCRLINYLFDSKKED